MQDVVVLILTVLMFIFVCAAAISYLPLVAAILA
jgi:hypothetical protein